MYWWFQSFGVGSCVDLAAQQFTFLTCVVCRLFGNLFNSFIHGVLLNFSVISLTSIMCFSCWCLRFYSIFAWLQELLHFVTSLHQTCQAEMQYKFQQKSTKYQQHPRLNIGFLGDYDKSDLGCNSDCNTSFENFPFLLILEHSALAKSDPQKSHS